MAQQTVETTDNLNEGRQKWNDNDTELYAAVATNASDIIDRQTISEKDATGGYAGLTLFKINFKNALNTITSFFTNANTVARTYTFQDKSGTIADLADIQVTEEVILTTTATLDATAYGKMHRCTGTSANYTVTLPAGADADIGKIICIKGDPDVANLNKQITIDGSGTEKVDSYLSKIITTSGYFTARLRKTSGVFYWDVINFEQGAYIDWTSTITFVGISGVTSGFSYRVVGKSLHVNIYPGQTSVGAGTSFTFTLPQGFTASLTGPSPAIRTTNNAAAFVSGVCIWTSGSSIVQCFSTINAGAWSGTGNRGIDGSFVIPIN